MKIKNKYIQPVYELFSSLELSGRQSILRTRFIREIIKHFNEVYTNEMNELIQEFADKDEQGNVKYGKDGSFTISNFVLEKYINESTSLDNDVYEFSLNEQNKPMLLAINDIVNNDEIMTSLSGIIAEAHYELFEECEKIVSFYNEN